MVENHQFYHKIKANVTGKFDVHCHSCDPEMQLTSPATTQAKQQYTRCLQIDT